MIHNLAIRHSEKFVQLAETAGVAKGGSASVPFHRVTVSLCVHLAQCPAGQAVRDIPSGRNLASGVPGGRVVLEFSSKSTIDAPRGNGLRRDPARHLARSGSGVPDWKMRTPEFVRADTDRGAVSLVGVGFGYTSTLAWLATRGPFRRGHTSSMGGTETCRPVAR